MYSLVFQFGLWISARPEHSLSLSLSLHISSSSVRSHRRAPQLKLTLCLHGNRGRARHVQATVAQSYTAVKKQTVHRYWSHWFRDSMCWRPLGWHLIDIDDPVNQGLNFEVKLVWMLNVDGVLYRHYCLAIIYHIFYKTPTFQIPFKNCFNMSWGSLGKKKINSVPGSHHRFS